MTNFTLKRSDPNELDEHFRANSKELRAGPIEDNYRSCNDICCLFTFLAMIIGILVVGGMMLNDGRQFYNQQFEANSQFVDLGNGFRNNAGLIIGMIFLGFALAVLYILLLKKFPKCMVYTMIGLIFLLLVIGVILGIVYQIIAVTIVCAITILLYGCILYCFRDRIKTGIVLLKAAATFITEKLSVFVAPLYSFIFSIMFLTWWIICTLAVIYTIIQKNNQAPAGQQADTSKEGILLFFWVIFFVFMTEFFYYVETFFIATACSFWYYSIDDNYYTVSGKRVNRYHIGSLTFAAMLVTIVNMLKRMVQEEAEGQSGGCAVLACIVGCCLQCIEDLLRILNHNSIIVMAVTGESYMNAAKTTLSIVFKNFALFNIVQFFSDLIVFFGIFFSAGIPILLTILISNSNSDASSLDTGITIVCVVVMCFLIASILIGMVGQALSCVFIFYCFDCKLAQNGIRIQNAPPCIQDFWREEQNRIQSAQQLKQ